jgi:ribosome-associated heat shock protein Hsp15
MYKSRTLAAEAIKGGKVKLNGENIKPSHIVKVGEKYTMTISSVKKIVEVVSVVDKRGSFEIARKHYVDHSPPPEKKDYIPAAFFKVNIRREKGSGRPTKKDRRDMEDYGSQN